GARLLDAAHRALRGRRVGAVRVPRRLSVRGMYVDRLKGERGGVLVLSAIMIPVFLLFTALVVDAGDWFTHKRQLQNRADAAAFAAGGAPPPYLKAGVPPSDPAPQAAPAGEEGRAAAGGHRAPAGAPH